jgi:hypothetical protein
MSQKRRLPLLRSDCGPQCAASSLRALAGRQQSAANNSLEHASDRGAAPDEMQKQFHKSRCSEIAYK